MLRRLDSIAPLLALTTLGLVLSSPRCEAAGDAKFRFERQVVDAKVEIGYGLAIADLDGDTKPDLLLADKREFAWYRNGDFARRTLHPALTERDNVCIAARDVGKGRPVIAIGGDWGPTDTTREGSAKFFALGELDDRGVGRRLETALDAEPTVHRMRFVSIHGSKGSASRPGSEEWALVVVPLHGRGNVDGAGDPVRVEAFLPIEGSASASASGFEKELVDASLHKTHNLDVGQWNARDESASPRGEQGDADPEEILLIGAEGARVGSRANGKWSSRPLEGIRGGGEIRIGARKDGSRIVATVEPMHGNTLALYTEKSDGTFERKELDTTLNQGHALAIADLDGDGEPEVVCGWREPDAKGETGVRIYTVAGGEPFCLDSTVACEDLKIADLDGDGRPDIVTAGRNSHDLVIFWNRG